MVDILIVGYFNIGKFSLVMIGLVGCNIIFVESLLGYVEVEFF